MIGDAVHRISSLMSRFGRGEPGSRADAGSWSWRPIGSISNSRNIRLVAFLCDVIMAGAAILAGLIIRYGNLSQIEGNAFLIGALVPFVLSAAVSFLILRTYRTSWRHASTNDLINIIYAATLTVVIYLLTSFVVTRLDDIPRTSVAAAWMVLILEMAGARVAYRLLREGRLSLIRRGMRADQVPILVVGSGSDAEIFLRCLNAGSHYYPVGVMDESGRAAQIHGVPVLGGIGELTRIVEMYGDAGDRPRKLAIADRSLVPEQVAQLVEEANRLGLSIARVPDPTVLRPGVTDSEVLAPFSVEDLLRRPQVILDPARVRSLIRGSRVLVTGAGGSIGGEIVRQVCEIGPAEICLLDASEFSLYTIDRTVQEKWPDVTRSARLIDVRHAQAVKTCFTEFRPDVVFHAAALKHVPLVEANPLEGIWTNAIGSRNVCDAAVQAGCRCMVMISTDKAVNPTSVMGASKRCAERYVRSAALSGASTRCIGVRFGNVLASTGSVVPLFERQLRYGGPLTVTHPEIERYFMTIREAVQLVLQAAALNFAGDNVQGAIFVLDMGTPVRIADLARQMIRLAGLRPDVDVPIIYTGLRPGEKLYEELVLGDEEIKPTSVPRLNIVTARAPETARAGKIFEDLEAACREGRAGDAIAILKSIVPEYAGRASSSSP